MKKPRRFVATTSEQVQREAHDLEQRGFDGLWHPSEPCGCFIGDLRPCGQYQTGCRGGYERENGIGPK